MQHGDCDCEEWRAYLDILKDNGEKNGNWKLWTYVNVKGGLKKTFRSHKNEQKT